MSSGLPESCATSTTLVEPVAEGYRIRVLLADDHAVVRDALKSLLETEPDLEVIGQAEDGEAAVSMARQMQPDVVLMDVHMPRLDGLEATRRIRQELDRVRVVGLSLHPEEEAGEAMQRAGATAYVCKCGPANMLCAAIRSAARELGRAPGRRAETA